MPEFIAPLQPVESWRVTQPFIPGQHYGIDFGNADGSALTIGTPVLAVADGTVSRVADEPGGAGLHTNVDHADQIQSRDFHLSGFAVNVGDLVLQGQVIGYSGNTGGSTGPHLHHEHRIDGVAVDPAPFLNAWLPPAPTVKEYPDVDYLLKSPDGSQTIILTAQRAEGYPTDRVEVLPSGVVLVTAADQQDVDLAVNRRKAGN